MPSHTGGQLTCGDPISPEIELGPWPVAATTRGRGGWKAGQARLTRSTFLQHPWTNFPGGKNPQVTLLQVFVLPQKPHPAAFLRLAEDALPGSWISLVLCPGWSEVPGVISAVSQTTASGGWLRRAGFPSLHELLVATRPAGGLSSRYKCLEGLSGRPWRHLEEGAPAQDLG